jgi:hypothetical protein
MGGYVGSGLGGDEGGVAAFEDGSGVYVEVLLVVVDGPESSATGFVGAGRIVEVACMLFVEWGSALVWENEPLSVFPTPAEWDEPLEGKNAAGVVR